MINFDSKLAQISDIFSYNSVIISSQLGLFGGSQERKPRRNRTYNCYPRDRGYPNWRIDSDGITLQIFRKWANDQNVVSDLDQ